MSSRKIAAEIGERTGVDVSVRTLLLVLGHKTDAVERAERVLRQPKPAARTATKPKAKPKRRKTARRASK